jgi:uncharacterized protein
VTVGVAIALGLALVTLLGAGVWRLFRGRPARVKLLAIPLVYVLAQWLVLPATGAILATVQARDPVPAAATLGIPGARDVSFRAADGVRLAGWWVPGRSGAAVVVAHGSHGDRADTLAHLRMLSAAGYAVLAYDARGHGRSAGRTNALGWDGAADAAGAVAYARRQPRVAPRRVAMLGLSMGAEAALRAAAAGVPLRAVVADGAGASTTGDASAVGTGALAPVATSTSWVTMRLVEGLTGDPEPAPLTGVVHRIRVPVLLVASNRAGEQAIDDVLRRRIGSRATLWSVGDAGHTRALQRHPAAYARRIERFLAAGLAGAGRAPR